MRRITAKELMESIPDQSTISKPPKPQLRLVELSPRDKRFLSALYEKGGGFNLLSSNEQCRIVGVYSRFELCKIRKSLEQAGYIFNEKNGNRVCSYLNPNKPMPSDLPGFEREALIDRCIEVDNLDARGARTDRYSPFQIRRREQIAVFKKVWAFFYPRVEVFSEDNIRYALTLCGDSLEEFFTKMESIRFDTGEIAFRNHKKTHVRSHRAYVLKSLERHAREMGRDIKPRKPYFTYKKSYDEE